MAADDPRIAAYEVWIAQLETLVAAQADFLDAQAAVIERLERRIAELERDASRHSGNSSKPPSTDSAEQRAMLAAKRKAKRVKGQRSPDKQPGAPGANLARVADPEDQGSERWRCVCCSATTSRWPGVAEILADLLGAPVSTGWVAGLTTEASSGLEPCMADLCDRLAASHVVHTDETGARVEGVKWWFHVASTATLTFLAVLRRRGVVATRGQ